MASSPRQVPPTLPLPTSQASDLSPSTSADPPPSPSSDPPPTSSTPPDPPSSTPPSSSRPPPPTSSSPPPPPLSSSQPPPSSSIPPSTSSSPQSPQDTSSTPPPPLPSSTPPPDTPAVLPTTNGTFTTSFTTIVSTRSDGSTFTTTSALPTALVSTPTSSHSSNRVGIVAGTTAAGIIILLLLLGVVFAYRRNKLQKLWDEVAMLSSSARRRERKGLLEDEDFDDDVGGGGGGMRMYRDRPGSTAGGIIGGHSRGASATSSGVSSYPLNNLGTANTAYDPPSNPFNSAPSTPTTHGAASFHTRTSSHSPAPSIFRAHTSDSGSIFREELGDDSENNGGNPYTDPFAGPSIHGSVTSLVPAAVTTPIPTTTPRAGSTTPPGNGNPGPRPHSRASPPSSPDANQIRSSTPPIVIPIRASTATPDRETRNTSMTSSTPTPIRRLPTPGSSSPGPVLPPSSCSTNPLVTQTTSASSHAPPTFSNPNTNAVVNNTITSATTGTSASMYSTSGTSARTSEFGFVSRGSTPPVPALPSPLPPSQYQKQPPQQQQHHGGGRTTGLPPGAAPSVTPGARVYTSKSSYSSLHSQASDVSDTSASASMYSQASAPYSAYSYSPPTQFQTSPFFTEGGVGGEREVSASTYFSSPPAQKGPAAAASSGGGSKVSRTPSPTTGVKGGSFGQEWSSGSGESTQMYSQGKYGPAGEGPPATVVGPSGVKLPVSQPKKSSPLARALSTDAKIFGR